MADATIKSYIIGIVIFTFVIVGGVSMLASMNNSQPGFTNNADFIKFNKTFNKFDTVQSKVSTLESGITDADSDPGTLGFLNAIIGSVWNVLRLIPTSFGFMTGVFTGMTTVFGVPSWIPALIGSLVTILIIFAIYKAVFQTEV
jgi:hypothetical protein